MVSLGNEQLVAYMVCDKTEHPTEAELSSFLGETLPSYMVPAVLVWLDVMPRLPNGKLDRTALPALDDIGRAAAYVAPRTPVEERLVAIWAEVLGVPQVGIEDNFFALGGHSLLAIKLITRIVKELGVDVSVGELLKAPTVAGLVTRLVLDKDGTCTERGRAARVCRGTGRPDSAIRLGMRARVRDR